MTPFIGSSSGGHQTRNHENELGVPCRISKPFLMRIILCPAAIHYFWIYHGDLLKRSPIMCHYVIWNYKKIVTLEAAYSPLQRPLREFIYINININLLLFRLRREVLKNFLHVPNPLILLCCHGDPEKLIIIQCKVSRNIFRLHLKRFAMGSGYKLTFPSLFL